MDFIKTTWYLLARMNLSINCETWETKTKTQVAVMEDYKISETYTKGIKYNLLLDYNCFTIGKLLREKQKCIRPSCKPEVLGLIPSWVHFSLLFLSLWHSLTCIGPRYGQHVWRHVKKMLDCAETNITKFVFVSGIVHLSLFHMISI